MSSSRTLDVFETFAGASPGAGASRRRRAATFGVATAATLLVACGGSNETTNSKSDGGGRDPGSAIQQGAKERDLETDFFALDLPEGWQQISLNEALAAGGTNAEELREAVQEDGVNIDTSGFEGSFTLVPPGVDVERQAIQDDPDDPQILYAVAPFGQGLSAAARPAASATTAEQLATALEPALGSGITRRPSATSLDGAPTVIVEDRQLIAAHDGRLYSVQATAPYTIGDRRLKDVERDLRAVAEGWSWK